MAASSASAEAGGDPAAPAVCWAGPSQIAATKAAVFGHANATLPAMLPPQKGDTLVLRFPKKLIPFAYEGTARWLGSKKKARQSDADIFVLRDNSGRVPEYGRQPPVGAHNDTSHYGISLFIPLGTFGSWIFKHAHAELAEDRPELLRTCSVSQPGKITDAGLDLWCDRILHAGKPFALHVLASPRAEMGFAELNSVACCSAPEGAWLPCQTRASAEATTDELDKELPDIPDGYLAQASYLLDLVVLSTTDAEQAFLAASFRCALAKESSTIEDDPEVVAKLGDGELAKLLLAGFAHWENEEKISGVRTRMDRTQMIKALAEYARAFVDGD